MQIEDLGKHFILCVLLYSVQNIFTELSNWLWICRGYWDWKGYQDHLDQMGLEVFQ